MTQRYLVIYEGGEPNLSGYAPDVPGCVSTGRSLDEMRTNLRNALAFHLEGLLLEGEPIPEPTTRVAEIPENGYAEWLAVPLPASQPISA